MKSFLLPLCTFLFITISTEAAVVTLYSEDFANGGSFPTGWTPDVGSTDWYTDDCSGTGQCSGGSGTWQILTTNGTGVQERIIYNNNLSTIGMKDITITWNAYKDVTFPGPITFEWSTDGASWNSETFTDVGTGAFASIPTFTLGAGANDQSNLRFRFTYTSDFFGGLYIIDDFLVQGTPFRFYSKAAGDLEVLATWGVNTDGTGVSPTNFTDNGVEYIITNNPTPTIGANWVVSGTGSSVSVGNGTFSTNFTIPAAFSMTGTAHVNNNATLSISHLTVNPTLGTRASGSTVVYNGAGPQTLVTGLYHNLTLSGSGAKTHTSANIIVNGVFTLSTPATLTMNTAIFNALILNGTVAGTGTFTGSANSLLTIGGTGDLGTLNFTAGSRELRQLTLNRTSSGTLTLGTDLEVSTRLNLSNGELVLNGNSFEHSGSLYSRVNGTFTGSSTSNLSFTGSGATTFTIAFTQTAQSTRTLNNLTVGRSGTGGVALSNPLEILGSVNLSGATLASGGNLTLKCSASQCANIPQITGTGAVSGAVNVERYSAGPWTGWGLLGSPVTSAITMSEWNDDIGISCSDCPDGPAAGFTSIMTYDETAAGNYNSAASYVAIPNYATPITNGQGYYVYYGTGFGTTTDITFDVTGTLRQGNIDLAPSYTASGGPADDGWNLLANPYPSPISWTSLETGAGTPANIDDTYYVWNADFNGANGGFAEFNHNTGISSPVVGSGGVEDEIPMCAGFFVHLTGATTLIAQESHKVTANPAYRKNGSSTGNPHSLATEYMRLQLDGQGYKDESVLIFFPGATDTFDTKYDGLKLLGSNPSQSYVALLDSSNMKYTMDALPPLTQNLSIPVYLKIGTGGSYTLSEDDIARIPGACINLYDSVTATTTDLRTTSYTFTISPGEYYNRFKLNVTIAPNLAMTSTSTQPVCYGVPAGEIIATPAGSGPWDYTWRDSVTFAVVKQSLNKSTPDTLGGLTGGSYIVEINTTGSCDFASSTFHLNTPDSLVSQFASSTDTAYISAGGAVSFTNNSVGANGQTWFFGDGSNSSITSPTHAYTTPGSYEVMLVSVNTTCGTSDTSRYTIEVLNAPVGTSVQNVINSNLITIGTQEHGAYVVFDGITNSNAIINVTNVLGQQLIPTIRVKENGQRLNINLENIKDQVLLLRVTTNDQDIIKKVSWVSHRN